ncbi:MAG: xanthine dehydrogenase molybdopterin binding subunit [Pseudomonadota bacterium]
MSRPHESAVGHVTGTANYVDDLPQPADTLHVATGYADAARATIAALRLDAVRAAPGVVDVVVAADIPGKLDVGPVYPGDPLLADGELRYAAQPLFAVAATSFAAAQRAARMIDVDVEPQPAILSVADALAADAAVLPSRHWHFDAESAATPSTPPAPPTQEATRIAGKRYIRGQEHFYLEGQVALAIPEDGGELRIYSSTQYPDEVQHLVAGVLGIPMHRVRVVCRRMGGAFGGKESQAASLACIAALFAWRTGRAVKYRMPRRDDMIQTGKRHDFHADYELACDAQGRLVDAKVTLAGKCGHSPDLSEGIVDRAMFHFAHAYYVPKIDITGHRSRTDTVSNTAFRGFGGPQGMLVMEAALDELAHAAAIDPLKLRRTNLFAPGRDVTAYGQRVEQFVLADMLRRLERDCDYRQRQATAREFNARHKRFKKGMALTPVQFGISFTVAHLNQTGALVHVYADGSIEVNHAGTEMGQGLHTKMIEVAARVFGVARERVRVTATQTDKVPNGSPTAASAGSDLNGMAVQRACLMIRARLAAFAASQAGESLGAAESTPAREDVRFRDGDVSVGAWRQSFDALVDAAYHARVQLSATGFYATPEVHFDKEAGRGKPFYYYAHGAAASEVVIDVTTGEYRILRVDILHDVGASLQEAMDRGQIEGGYVQGLGWLTTEELLWDDAGRVISNSPANYKIPTAHDRPRELNIDLYRADNPQPTIRRSKAVGEPPLMLAISTWCALRDAASAAGEHAVLPRLAAPATPEAVFWAVREATGASQDAS